MVNILYFDRKFGIMINWKKNNYFCFVEKGRCLGVTLGPAIIKNDFLFWKRLRDSHSRPSIVQNLFLRSFWFAGQLINQRSSIPRCQKLHLWHLILGLINPTFFESLTFEMVFQYLNLLDAHLFSWVLKHLKQRCDLHVDWFISSF